MARKSKCSLDYGQLVLILCISLTVLVSSAQSRSLRKSRRSMDSEETSTSSTPVRYCNGNSPCGWAVYVPATRTVDYFMRNTCVCPKDKGCIKTDDDLSVSAYVYRCRPET